MFTLQAGQIENALRGAGVPDLSAKEMMQGVANCQMPVEHRGPVAMTRVPRDNFFLFPGTTPVGGTPSFYFSNNQTTINIPPWQNIPFEPIPYPDFPTWSPIPYPDSPATDTGRDTTVVIPGPVGLGPVQTPEVSAGDVFSTTINNAGDIVNQNSFVNIGQVFHDGPVFHNQQVIHNDNVTNNRNVYNAGDVYNTQNTYNQQTYNYGPTNNYGDTHHYGDTYLEQTYSSGPVELTGPVIHHGDTSLFGGDVTVEGDEFRVESTTINLGGDDTTTVVIQGDTITLEGDVYLTDPSNPSGPPLGPLTAVSLQVLTDIEWDGSSLSKSYVTLLLLGNSSGGGTGTVVSGTSCPSTPLSGSASNFVDMP